MFRFKYRYYYKSILLVFFILIPVFLLSCSKSEPKSAEQISFPTLKFTPKSNLSINQSLKLARQIQLLTNNTEIIRISDTKSMIPTLDSNTLVIIEKITIFESLQVGDIITYKVDNKDSPFFDELILHRIYSIDPESKTLFTKGDNNDLCDPEVKYSQIYGRIFCIIYCSEEIK